MTGIAAVESSYMQFRTFTLFGRRDLWPLESYDSGSHIGLMQVPTNMRDAWSWLANTQTGVRIFRQKISTAKRKERQIINDFKKKNPDIKIKDIEKLTGIQIENMALVLYGEHASSGLDKQYYILCKENERGVWK